MRTELKAGATVRLTLLTSCQSGCDFCHLEGFKSKSELGTLNPAIAGWKNTNSFDNAATDKDVDRTIEIASALSVRNVNITGGEPTLFPKLRGVIKKLSTAGLSTAITTHAEISPSSFAKFFDGYLEWVIVSVHAIDAEDYLSMDLVAQNIAKKRGIPEALRYSARRIANKKANIKQALEAQEAGLINGVLTNTVMRSVSQTVEIIQYCNKLGIIPRIQRDLNGRQASQVYLDDIIHSLEATRVGVQMAVGDSSGAGVDYRYHDSIGRENFFRVKDFGDVYIPKMCDGCDLKDTELCRERFYGVRIESNRVRTCIDREVEGRTMFEGDTFISLTRVMGTVPQEIISHYSDSYTANENSTTVKD